MMGLSMFFIGAGNFQNTKCDQTYVRVMGYFNYILIFSCRSIKFMCSLYTHTHRHKFSFKNRRVIIKTVINKLSAYKYVQSFILYPASHKVLQHFILA